ncbi:MAG: restriction endonuclease [Promethearchaeota archaeon]
MFEETPLQDLARQFFSNKFAYEEPDGMIRGESGQKWKFDAIIKYNEQKFGIFVRQWNRAIGVNQVRQLEKAVRDTDCSGGLMVGSYFSSNALKFGKNTGIQLLDRLELIAKLRGNS